jgi:serine/threonine protein kinase
MATSSLQTISWETIQLGQLIGHGGYGDVYEGTWYGKIVAIKKLLLKKLPEHLLQDFKKETELMAQFNCPQIVSIFGTCLEEHHYAMVIEYMPKTSLYKVLQDQSETLPWNPTLYTIASDIVKGLAYLHSQKIIHRDLKSLNILLGSDYHAKITDFGLATIKKETSSTTTQSNKSLGTVRWLAPELLKRGAKHTFASDVYAAGMVL